MIPIALRNALKTNHELWRTVLGTLLLFVLAMTLSDGLTYGAERFVPSRGYWVYQRDQYVFNQSLPNLRGIRAWARQQADIDYLVFDYPAFTTFMIEYMRPASLSPLQPPWKMAGVPKPVTSSHQISHRFMRNRTTYPLGFISIHTASQIGLLLVALPAYIACTRKDKVFRIRPARAKITYGIAACVTLLLVEYWYYQYMGHSYNVRSLDAALSVVTFPIWARLFVIVSWTVFTPVCEELLFRGVLAHSFYVRGYTVFGTLFSALIFAAAHRAPLIDFPMLVLCGVLLGWAYHYYRSLWVPIAFHGVLNGAMLLSVWTIDRTDAASVFSQLL